MKMASLNGMTKEKYIETIIHQLEMKMERRKMRGVENSQNKISNTKLRGTTKKKGAETITHKPEMETGRSFGETQENQQTPAYTMWDQHIGKRNRVMS